MNINDIIRKVAAFKRFECIDFAFSDTEVYIEDSQGNEVGSGYFTNKHADMSITIDEITYKFTQDDARRLRSSIQIAAISRNDNEGKW